MPPALEDWVILGMPALIGLLLLTLPFFASKGERSPKRRPWAVAVTLVAIIVVGTRYVTGERAPRSPKFDAQPLSADVVGATNGPVAEGAALYTVKGCQACHAVSGHGGERGLDLSNAGDRLTREQWLIRTLDGGGMPAYAGTISQDELTKLTTFLETRKQQTTAGGR